MSVSSWKPEIVVLTYPVSSKRPAKLSVQMSVSQSKIGEGNYDNAFRVGMGEGRNVIARVPHHNAGPPLLTTASEVATMEFVRTVLNIPVPQVFA